MSVCQDNQRDHGLPIFTSLDGKPINFRIVGNERMKARYRLLITNYGGAVVKNSGVPRLNIVHGDMPCEEGHQNCPEHLPFEGEPLFKASWVDHCVSQKELLNISVYLMNPTPGFAKINFARRLETGYYTPTVLSSLSKRKPLNQTPSYRLLSIDLSAPTNPDVIAEMKTIASFVNENENDPTRPILRSKSEISRERQKKDNVRAGPLSSSTPFGSLAGQPPKRHKDNSSSHVRHPSPLEEMSTNVNRSRPLQDEDAEDSGNARTKRKSQTRKVANPNKKTTGKGKKYNSLFGTSSGSDSCFDGLSSLLDSNQPSRIAPRPETCEDTVPPAEYQKNQLSRTDSVTGPSKPRLQPLEDTIDFAQNTQNNQNSNSESPISDLDPELGNARLSTAGDASKPVQKGPTNQKNPPSRIDSDPGPGPSKKQSLISEDTNDSTQESQKDQNRPVFCGITYSSSDSDTPTKPPPVKKKAVPAQQGARSESDDEFGPPPGAIVRLKGVKQNTRAAYTHMEEVAILKYILAGKKLEGLRSNVVWKQMDGKPGVERRTWQSLREHFLKKMLPKLDRFNLTRDQIQRMKKTS